MLTQANLNPGHFVLMLAHELGHAFGKDGYGVTPGNVSNEQWRKDFKSYAYSRQEGAAVYHAFLVKAEVVANMGPASMSQSGVAGLTEAEEKKM